MLSSDNQKIHRLIWRVFTNTHGLVLRTEAVEYLRDRLGSTLLSEKELFSALSYIATTYKKQPNRPNLIDSKQLEAVIEGMLKLNTTDNQNNLVPAKNFLFLVNVRDCPRWNYDPHQKQFHIQKDFVPSMVGHLDSRINMFRRHYEILKQRLLRSEEFNGPNSPKLMSIKSIKGQHHGERKFLFGMLSLIKEGEIYLEDIEDFIKLDLSKVEHISLSLYTETSFVVIGGIPNGDVLNVEFMSPPPVEDRQTSTSTLSHPNYTFGQPFAESMAQFRSNENLYSNTTIVVISDLWIDCQRTLSKFEGMLSTLLDASQIPAAFILCGPFVSVVNPSISHLENSFSSLATSINKYPDIKKQSRFIFVPSKDDLMTTLIYPQPPLSEYLLEALKSSGIDCSMASNPTRLFLFTKEIVVFRDDVSVKLKRNLLPGLEKYADSNVTTIKTLLEQAHLSPLPLNVQNRAWDFDHSFTLYPVPDYV